jgi:hypothetical protein
MLTTDVRWCMRCCRAQLTQVHQRSVGTSYYSQVCVLTALSTSGTSAERMHAALTRHASAATSCPEHTPCRSGITLAVLAHRWQLEPILAVHCRLAHRKLEPSLSQAPNGPKWRFSAGILASAAKCALLQRSLLHHTHAGVTDVATANEQELFVWL